MPQGAIAKRHTRFPLRLISTHSAAKSGYIAKTIISAAFRCARGSTPQVAQNCRIWFFDIFSSSNPSCLHRPNTPSNVLSITEQQR